MTKKLYEKDPYMREFDTKVLEIDGNKVVLDQTCFYPEGGGQRGDTGEINEIRVMNTEKEVGKIIRVEEKEGFKEEKPIGSKVIHILEREPDFKVGDTVHGKIDWERRFKIMRLHSAAHFTYYVVRKVFGDLRIKGSYVDDKKDRLDFEHEGRLDPEKIQEAEKRVNELLVKNLEIKRYNDAKNPELLCWETEGLPVMHCGGTHPKNTQEIGQVRLKRKNPGKGLERIETYLVE